jgi:2-C-methyl-D-erythritol 4-phosphate cytidylyltransferase
LSSPSPASEDQPPESALWALVPAAGVGARMGADRPKQYLPLFGRPILQHTLERLGSYVPLRGIFVGLSPGDAYWPSLPPHLPKVLGTFPGGQERAHTVLNGLKALLAHAASHDWVMVHDAVRPCVRHGDIDKLVRAVAGHPDGGLLGLPLMDTVKRVDPMDHVVETVPRAGLWRALTPQLFPVARLRRALEAAVQQGVAITDEAAAIELDGGHPRMVAGHGDNIKITLPADIELAEMVLKQQARERG